MVTTLQQSKIKHIHPLPLPNSAFCSCCRKSIIKDQHNVVKINSAPEGIFDLTGKCLGMKGTDKPKAFYHATCFQDHHNWAPGRIECKYCGVLSMAKVLLDGTKVKDMCQCSCHNGTGDYCSLIVL